MTRMFLFVLFAFTLNSCSPQTGNAPKAEEYNPKKINDQSEGVNGIVYFSSDNGASWVNASSGLPQKVSIGLDGIAVSNENIGIATKEYGIYVYDFVANNWVSVPTDQQIIEGNIGALSLFDDAIYIGTQHKGLFFTKDNGKTWMAFNLGLNNLTIRRFFEFDSKLYVCTNDGFYVLSKEADSWQLEIGQNSLQVNGATAFEGSLYLATNKGIYKQQNDNSWTKTSPGLSLHNISSDNQLLYAMTYNELLLSSKDGVSWQSQQDGLPKNLYTFNVLSHNDITLAGQWDGVYKKTKSSFSWEPSSEGLPSNFAATNLKVFNNILVISTSERVLNTGVTTDK